MGRDVEAAGDLGPAFQGFPVLAERSISHVTFENSCLLACPISRSFFFLLMSSPFPLPSSFGLSSYLLAAIATYQRTPGGEGCSTAGGCATCPFMKMNDLDALMDVAANADQSGAVTGEYQQQDRPHVMRCLFYVSSSSSSSSSFSFSLPSSARAVFLKGMRGQVSASQHRKTEMLTLLLVSWRAMRA